MTNLKARLSLLMVIGAILLFGVPNTATAHFGALIPSDDMITQQDNKNIKLDIMFMHPMEFNFMDMEKPIELGVMIGGKRVNLTNRLREKIVESHKAWEATYRIKRPGDHIFYVVPKPYWEPAEDHFIVHYTKVVVNSLGLEEGWDNEVGLETEIIPLTRPYGLWTGNVFRGIVKVKGRPAPDTAVEVEYYNKGRKVSWPADPMITQVVKTDTNGIFSYAFPRAGWWAFAALNEADRKIEHEGEPKSIEIGAVIWVRVYDMK